MDDMEEQENSKESSIKNRNKTDVGPLASQLKTCTITDHHAGIAKTSQKSEVKIDTQTTNTVHLKEHANKLKSSSSNTQCGKAIRSTNAKIEDCHCKESKVSRDPEFTPLSK